MTEPEQQRRIRHRLAVIRHAEEITGNGIPDGRVRVKKFSEDSSAEEGL